jgi:hypothetical protein
MCSADAPYSTSCYESTVPLALVFCFWCVTSVSMQELLSRYSDFLKQACTGKVAQLATAMYECSIADERMARHLYACIFPILWASLEQEEQMSLARPIVQLLTRVSDRQYEDSLQDGSSHIDSAAAALKVLPRAAWSGASPLHKPVACCCTCSAAQCPEMSDSALLFHVLTALCSHMILVSGTCCLP